MAAGPLPIPLPTPSSAIILRAVTSGAGQCAAAGVKRRQDSPLFLPAAKPPAPPSSTFLPPASAGLFVAGRAGPPPSLAPMQIGRTCGVHLSVSSLQASLPPAVDVFGFTAKAPS